MWPGVTTSRWGCGIALSRRGCFTALARTSAATFSAFACGTGFWPTTATGAVSHRPTQGACTTRTSGPRRPGNVANSSSRAGHLARDRVADAHGDRGRRACRPSPRRSGDRTWPLRRPRPSPSSFRRPERRGATRRGSRSDPESCGDARSADPAGAGRRREAPARPHAPAGRPGGLSGLERARLSAFLALRHVAHSSPAPRPTWYTGGRHAC